MAVTTSSPASAKRSWADIVKGSDSPTDFEPSAKSALQPATRGERRCFCQGEILVMLGHYGWIMTFDDIDHPDVDKTAGRVYVHKRDIEKGVSLEEGDVVSFYLYVDDQGLGAELCQFQHHRISPGDIGQVEKPELVEEALSQKIQPSTLRADALDFLPGSACTAPSWNLLAAEFIPGPSVPPMSFNTEAAEFVPTEIKFVNTMVPSNPNVLSINPAFLSDDESDDEDSISNNSCGMDADKESLDSDEESSDTESMRVLSHTQDIKWSLLPDAMVNAPLKPTCILSCDDSTSAGTSDSEAEEVSLVSVRPPPGLTLPKGFRPPPGLTLP